MVARPKFEPIGDELSPQVAWVQAAIALDIAGLIAQKREDIEGLCNVASLYTDLAQSMIGVVQADEEEIDQEALERKQPLGFSPCPAVIPVEEVELENE